MQCQFTTRLQRLRRALSWAKITGGHGGTSPPEFGVGDAIANCPPRFWKNTAQNLPYFKWKIHFFWGGAWKHPVWLPQSSLGFQRPVGRRTYFASHVQHYSDWRHKSQAWLSLIVSIIYLTCLDWNNGSQFAVCRLQTTVNYYYCRKPDGIYGSLNIAAQRCECKRVFISWPTFTLLSLPLCLEWYNRP